LYLDYWLFNKRKFHLNPPLSISSPTLILPLQRRGRIKWKNPTPPEEGEERNGKILPQRRGRKRWRKSSASRGGGGEIENSLPL